MYRQKEKIQQTKTEMQVDIAMFCLFAQINSINLNSHMLGITTHLK